MSTTNKIFWHELPKEEQATIKKTRGLTLGEFMQRYEQPGWCGYPEALAGHMGCWSLILVDEIHSIQDCGTCEYCTKPAPRSVARSLSSSPPGTQQGE